MKTKILLTVIALIGLGCVEDKSDLTMTGLLETEVKVKEDYIVISKAESLTPLLQKIAGMSRKELDTWEEEKGFTSLRRILNKAIEEETKYFDKLEAIGEENLKKEEVNPHALYVLDNAKYFKFNDDGWFELNIANQDLAPLLNKDGII